MFNNSFSTTPPVHYIQKQNPTTNEDGTECSETSEPKIQTSEFFPKRKSAIFRRRRKFWNHEKSNHLMLSPFSATMIRNARTHAHAYTHTYTHAHSAGSNADSFNGGAPGTVHGSRCSLRF